jgi:putative PIN family toxin of toxin-antitoxin system
LTVYAVIDTNLIISYLLTQGETLSQLIDLWEDDQFFYVTSTEILQELEEVVNRPKLRVYIKGDPTTLIVTIKNDALIVPGEFKLTGICRDPKDDKFIACAVEGGANYIVTGDKDLLDLISYKNIKMIRVLDFIKLFSEGSP